MYGIRLNNGVGLAFFLASVIDVKVAKIDASFLAIYKNSCLHNSIYFYSKSM